MEKMLGCERELSSQRRTKLPATPLERFGDRRKPVNLTNRGV
jgi:hypothetical protein